MCWEIHAETLAGSILCKSCISGKDLHSKIPYKTDFFYNLTMTSTNQLDQQDPPPPVTMGTTGKGQQVYGRHLEERKHSFLTSDCERHNGFQRRDGLSSVDHVLKNYLHQEIQSRHSEGIQRHRGMGPVQYSSIISQPESLIQFNTE